MGLAVPMMDDDLAADMSTVFSDTDVAKAPSSTIMVVVTNMETILTLTPATNSDTIPGTSADGSNVLWAQQIQELCQDLKVYS